MKLQEILLELLLLATDKERLRQYGEEIIDEFKEGSYTLILTKNRYSEYYQVGLTSDEQEFTTSSSQIKKPTDKSTGEIIQTWGRIAKKLKQWVDTYEKIAVGSFNRVRTAKYRRILKNFGLDVSEIYELSHGDVFYIYKNN
jgi:hypothetical protein